jgi:AraC family transcriptional regulator
MTLVHRTPWQIACHLAGDLSLAGLSAGQRVTAPHLARGLGDPAAREFLTPMEFIMSDQITLSPPTIAAWPRRHFVGLSRHYDHASKAGIPAQWGDFNAADPDIPDTLGQAAYGIVYNFADDAWDYACAYERRKAGPAPRGLVAIDCPAADYSVFDCPMHISAIDAVMNRVFEWVAASDRSFGDGPVIERYGKEFDPVTGEGGFQICVPLSKG